MSKKINQQIVDPFDLWTQQAGAMITSTNRYGRLTGSSPTQYMSSSPSFAIDPKKNPTEYFEHLIHLPMSIVEECAKRSQESKGVYIPQNILDYIRARGYSYGPTDQAIEALNALYGKPPIEIPKVSLDSVIISEQKKQEIRAAISQIDFEDLIFKEWGFGEVFEKGTAISLLFWGIPGTGKTLMAQAIADETGGELKMYGTAEIESMEPGGAERMIKKIFAEAKKKTQTGKNKVLLFDECDSLLVSRDEVGSIIGAQVNTLLQELERHTGIVIFTTNRMGKLDAALERRITAKVEFEFPDEKQREEIWKRLIPKAAPIDSDVEFQHLAEYPLAGGNIKNAVLNAARMAAFQKSKTITMEHFKNSIEREAASLQAFAAEYEKQTHSSLVGYTKGRGLVVDKKMVKKRVISSVYSNSND